jgi:tRNA(Phe) wybutosine-synthesizing methylase Tyw3
MHDKTKPGAIKDRILIRLASQKPLGRLDCDIVEMLNRWSRISFEFLV